MSQVFKPGHKIGILGGGQLARMLALSAHAMGATPLVLSENPQDPAQQVVSKPWIGSLKDPDVLKKFIETVDILTFESEFIDCDLLEKIAGVHKKKFFHLSTMLAFYRTAKHKKLSWINSKFLPPLGFCS